MLKRFFCKDGTVFARSTSSDASVDEIIDFLEAYRGMRFWNGAAGNIAFRVVDGVVCCDSEEYTVTQAYIKSQTIGEQVEDLFYYYSCESREEQTYE